MRFHRSAVLVGGLVLGGCSVVGHGPNVRDATPAGLTIEATQAQMADVSGMAQSYCGRYGKIARASDLQTSGERMTARYNCL